MSERLSNGPLHGNESLIEIPKYYGSEEEQKQMQEMIKESAEKVKRAREEKIRKIAEAIFRKRMNIENDKESEELEKELEELGIEIPKTPGEEVDKMLREQGIEPWTPAAEEFMRNWDWEQAEKLYKEWLAEKEKKEKEEEKRKKEAEAEEEAEEEEIKREDLKVYEVASESVPSGERKEKGEPNEDTVLIDKENNLYGVFDGMGGHAAGEVASSMASKIVQEVIRKRLKEGARVEETIKVMKDALIEANNKILEVGEKNENYKGMGTTASVVKILEGPEGKKYAVIAHVGNSRVYRQTPEGKLKVETIDSWVYEQAKAEIQYYRPKGPIEEGEVAKLARNIQERLSSIATEDDYKSLPPDMNYIFSNRNKTPDAVGRKEEKDFSSAVKCFALELKPGEKIILTTNGIHDNLTDKEIEEILKDSKYKTPKEKTDALIQAAQKRSKDKNHIRARDDDMSVVVIDVPQEERKEEMKEPEGENKEQTKPPRSKNRTWVELNFGFAVSGVDLETIKAAWETAQKAGFTPEELKDLVLQARGFIEVNVKDLISKEEIQKAKELLGFLKEKGIGGELFTDNFKLFLENLRNRLLEEGGEKIKIVSELEKLAQEIGIELKSAPKELRPEVIKEMIEKLKDKLKYEKAGEFVDPEKLKKELGGEKGLFGEIINTLFEKEKETLRSVFSDPETKKREKEIIKKIGEVLKKKFGEEIGKIFTSEKCQDIFYAMKSWLLQEAAQEEKPQGEGTGIKEKIKKIARIGASITKGLAKGFGFAGIGFLSTLATGALGGFLITGSLRQIDLARTKLADIKRANRFREKKKENAEFRNKMEDMLALLVSNEIRRGISREKLKELPQEINERTKYYFDQILKIPEIANDPNLSEQEKIAIAQHLAVHYALDDETEERLMEAESRRSGLGDKILEFLSRIDKRLVGNTLLQRFVSSMAMTGIGLALRTAFQNNSDVLRWIQGAFFAYGGWQMGGVAYELVRGREAREVKDPVAGAELRIKEANNILKQLKDAEGEGGFNNLRNQAKEILRARLSEIKVLLEQASERVAKGPELKARFEVARKEFQRLQNELIFVEFGQREEKHFDEKLKEIEEKLAAAQVEAEAKISKKISKEKWIERGFRGAGAVAFALLGPEVAQQLSKFIQPYQVKLFQKFPFLLKFRPDLRAALLQSEGVPGEASMRPEPEMQQSDVELDRLKEPETLLYPQEPYPETSPELLLEHFKDNHHILTEQGWETTYEGDKFVVKTEIGKGKDFTYLDQALRRLVMQEYNLEGKRAFTSLDGARVENAVANLRQLILGHDIAGMNAEEVAEFAHYNPKTGELIISDYGKFEEFANDKLLPHSYEIIKSNSEALAYTNNTSHSKWQEMLDQRAQEPGAHQVYAENFDRDPLVKKAEYQIFLREYQNNIRIKGELHIINESNGYITTPNGYEIEIEGGKVTRILDLKQDGFPLVPEQEIRLDDPKAGEKIVEAIDNWEWRPYTTGEEIVGIDFHEDLGLTDNKKLILGTIIAHHPDNFSEWPLGYDKYGLRFDSTSKIYFFGHQGEVSIPEEDFKVFLKNYGEKPINELVNELKNESDRGLARFGEPRTIRAFVGFLAEKGAQESTPFQEWLKIHAGELNNADLNKFYPKIQPIEIPSPSDPTKIVNRVEFEYGPDGRFVRIKHSCDLGEALSSYTNRQRIIKDWLGENFDLNQHLVKNRLSPDITNKYDIIRNLYYAEIYEKAHQELVAQGEGASPEAVLLKQEKEKILNNLKTRFKLPIKQRS